MSQSAEQLDSVDPPRKAWVWTVWAVAIFVTAMSGILHGRMSQRWGSDGRMEAAAEQLSWFPQQLGDWKQVDEFELRKSAIDLLSCQGYVNRGYRNVKTGDYIKLAIMVGPGSRMSVHVPEICYEANNFTLLEARRQYEIAAADQTNCFWGVLFQLNDVSQQRLRVLYGWSEGGAWQAPQYPRWSVAGSPVLYKLQLSFAESSASASEQRSEAVLADFLQRTVEAFKGAREARL
ncbi:MAG: exosortase-associated EpsI family protein [Planctomycetales bacterium]|nr:exosortase-associated EpsI family protein [Planctomycetales bacterium]